MTDDDILSRATRALREDTRHEDDAAAFTRARVLASVRTRRVRQRTRVALLLPIAACFVAATAWGAATGQLTRAFHRVEQVLGVRASPLAPTASSPKLSAAPRAAFEPPPAPAPAPQPEPAPPPAPESAPSPATPAAPSSPSPASAPVPSASASDSDPSYDLYRTAHRAHFVDHDSSAALTAWDAYLRAAPSGQFSLEARYNRALCLIKLGRGAEAKSALQAFADGRYGAYRRHEAAELLRALDAQ